MKKIVLLFSALGLIISVPARSQSSGIGIIGGLNFANFNSTDSDTTGSDYSSLLGYKGGAVVDLGFSRNFGLRLEPMYVQKGAERNGFFQDEHGQSFPVKSDVTLSYLELPVLFKYSMGNGNIRPYLVGGAGVSYLLSAKEKFTGGYAVPNQEIDIKDDLKSIDFEISGGAGLSFPIGKASLFIESRYSLGLNNISVIEGTPNTVKTRGFQVMIGATFPLNRISLQDAKSCCCCVDEVSAYAYRLDGPIGKWISSETKQSEPDAKRWGHHLYVMIILSYPPATEKKGFSDCSFEWYEKTPQPELVLFKPEDKNKLILAFGSIEKGRLGTAETIPGGKSWLNRKKVCPSVERITLTDKPTVGLKDNPERDLDIYVVVKSAKDCPDCEHNQIILHITQNLTVKNGKGDVIKMTKEQVKDLPKD